MSITFGHFSPWQYTALSIFSLLTYFEKLSITPSENEDQKGKENIQFAAALKKLPQNFIFKFKNSTRIVSWIK